MLQKNSPGRKNIRRISALDRLAYSKNLIKMSKEDDKETKERKTNKIKILETMIANTQDKIVTNNTAIGIKTKKLRG